MIKVAFFVNKKILTKDNSFFWQFNLKDLEASNHKQIEESLGFTISGIKEICENTFVAHIDKGNIESIEKHKNATAFVSLKEIESQDEDVDLLVKHIKEYYNNSEFLFDFKSTDYMTDQINTQVFGFCIDSQKRCCIVRDVSEENWTLPGGGCEFGERIVNAFKREVREEAQMSLKNVEILGYIVVRVFKENVLIEEILQSRLAAHSDIIDDFIPQKDGFETAERKFVEIDELPLYIDWLSFDSGKEILSKLKSYTDSVKK